MSFLCFSVIFSVSARIRSTSASALAVRRRSTSGLFLICLSSSSRSSLTVASSLCFAEIARRAAESMLAARSWASFSCNCISASCSSRLLRSARSVPSSCLSSLRRACKTSCSLSKLRNCCSIESPSSSSSTLRISVARPVADTHSSSNLVATHLQQQLLDLQFRNFVPGASWRIAASGHRSSGGSSAFSSRQLVAKTSAMPEFFAGADQPSSLADSGRTVEDGPFDTSAADLRTCAEYGLAQGSTISQRK
mmetsp:Transcript_85449/g.135493  ORF Transcript_85449/g.135493 Transcript_85449/m.135493 type:complete len:251 (+) Transcript_85449:43-795(+)